MDHWVLSPWYLTAMAAMAAVVLVPYLAGCHSNSRTCSLLRAAAALRLARGYYCVSPLPRFTSAAHHEPRSADPRKRGKSAEKKNSRGERTNEICISVRKSQLMEPLWVSKSAIYPPPRQEYTRFPGVCSKALMWPKKGALTLNV